MLLFYDFIIKKTMTLLWRHKNELMTFFRTTTAL